MLILFKIKNVFFVFFLGNQINLFAFVKSFHTEVYKYKLLFFKEDPNFIFRFLIKKVAMNTPKETLIKQSAELYEMVGYPRIAGRIMGLLYVSDQKYFTFQELMDTLNISKGATSKAIKFLMEINEIDFIIKKENKRRRYFYISEKGSVKSLESWAQSLLIRKNILEQILQLRTDENPEVNHFIQQMIAFTKDIYPFVEDKIKEHFINK